jgi:tetratricopeptide (TPR) repeat protein
MNRLKHFVFSGLVFCLFGTSRPVFAQQLVPPAAKVGSLLVDNVLAGSCFFIDTRGYVATSFSNLMDANSAWVQFANGSKCQVLGVVAACKGKDIAILRIAKTGSDSFFDVPLELDISADPKLDEPFFLWGGPRSVPMVRTLMPPKVKRTLLGEEYILGLPTPSSSGIGCDPDSRWIWLSLSGHISFNGGPLFDQRGAVVGMLSASLQPGFVSISDSKAIVYSAIHIEHVKRLVPVDNPKLKSLTLLSTWMDDIPGIDTPLPNEMPHEETSSLGGVLRRQLPLANRFIDLRRRVMQMEQEIESAGKKKEERQNDNLEKLAEIEKLQESKRRTNIEQTVLQLQSQIQTNQNDSRFDDVIRTPFLERLASRLEEEYFYLCDPLEFRNKSDKKNLEEELTQVIDEGGAGGVVYLARAIARVALGDLVGAERDLEETDEVDAKFQTITRLLKVRISLLKKDTISVQSRKNAVDVAISSLKKELESDARLQVLAARMAMDSNDIPSAQQHLEQAAKLAPDEIEIKHALTWVLLGVPKVNAKRVTQEAIRLVQKTSGRDWSSMAALAAAYSHGEKKERAVQAIDAAIRIAPPHAIKSCESMRNQLHQDLPIKTVW